MDQYPNLKKLINQKILKIIALIGCVMTIALCIIGAIVLISPTDEPMALNDSMNGKGNDYCYIDVQFMSEYFATYGTDDKIDKKYYFVSDGDYYYIATIKDKALDHELRDVYLYSMSDEDLMMPASVRLTGKSLAIEDDLLQIAMDSMNEWFGEEVVTEENVDEVLGTLYLDSFFKANDEGYMYFVFALFTGLLTFIFAIVLFSNSSHNKKEIARLSNYDLSKVESILEYGNGRQIEKTPLCLTDHYIICKSSVLQIIKYEEVAWVYLFKQRMYGIPTQINLMIGRTDGKVVGVCPTSPKREDELIEIMKEISEEVPNCLIGFTKENQKYFKEHYKNKK